MALLQICPLLSRILVARYPSLHPTLSFCPSIGRSHLASPDVPEAPEMPEAAEEPEEA